MNDDRRYNRKTPCSECPFRRDCLPGIGNPDPTVYVGQAIGPFLLSCHMDPGYATNPRSTDLMQCAGAAMFRMSLGVNVLMPPGLHSLTPDGKAFTSAQEMIAHHRQITVEEAAQVIHDLPLMEMFRREMSKTGVQILPKDQVP